MQPTTDVSVRPVETSAESDLFLRLPERLGGAAAGWSVPLLVEARWLADPRTSPILQGWEVARFLAWRDGRVVGRITAARPLPPAEAPGSFGFLVLEPDAAILRALLGAARSWLWRRGVARWRGPMSVSINHEIGAQIAGFGRPGSLHMPTTPDWLPAMLDAVGLDAAGLAREMTLHACLLRVAEERHRARAARLLAAWEGAGDLVIRRFDRRRYAAESLLVATLYNDGWAANWGAQAIGPEEAAGIGRLMRPALLMGEVFFAIWRGRPIGLCAILPDPTAAIEACGGRLLPWGWLRLARAMLPGGTDRARIPLLGTIAAMRGTPASAHAMAALLSAAIDQASRRGWAEVEISWILDTNLRMRQAMARLPAPIDRSWALWGGPLEGAGTTPENGGC